MDMKNPAISSLICMQSHECAGALIAVSVRVGLYSCSLLGRPLSH